MNHRTISGRIAATPVVNTANNRIVFRIIHNFGGDTEPLGLNFVAFKTKKGFPAGVEGLKKGDNVIVAAFLRPNNYTNAEGEVEYRSQLIVKNVKINESNESVNDFILTGRLAADPTVKGKTMTFRLIHNFGGDKAPMGQNYVAFQGKDGKWPEGLDGIKKGDAVQVAAFERPNNYTNETGSKLYRSQTIVKRAEPWTPAKTDEEAATEDAAVEGFLPEEINVEFAE